MAEQDTAATEKVDAAPADGADANPTEVATKTEAADAPSPSTDKPAEPDKKPATLAEGVEAVEHAVPQDFPDDWAKRLAGEDEGLLGELERQGTLANLVKSWKSAQDKIRSGDKDVAVPGEGATDEEKAAYHAAIGVPEKAEGYFDKLTLTNDRVLGEADQTVFSSFAEAMHSAGAPQAVVDAAVNWQLDIQAAEQEAQAEQDHEYHVNSEIELKKELGGRFKSTTNAIGVMWQKLGLDAETVENFHYARMPNGQLLGNYVPFIKALGDLAIELNPAAAAHDDATGNMQSIEDELAQLSKLSSSQSDDYWGDNPTAKRNQARRQELLEIRDRLRARAA